MTAAHVSRAANVRCPTAIRASYDAGAPAPGLMLVRCRASRRAREPHTSHELHSHQRVQWCDLLRGALCAHHVCAKIRST